VIIIGFVVYSFGATKTGLWYDEGVEYFYSKKLTGNVPGGFETTNMYERVLHTYQPPLYNVLMHIWLFFFDTEFMFRFFGILVTMIGAIGCYCTLNLLSRNKLWSLTGLSLYIFSWGISYYGLECAEYNLMICFISWTIFFFFKSMDGPRLRDIICFFVFASLSVYTQYGAAFLVVGMYVALFGRAAVSKNRKMMKWLLISTGITLLVAVLPLMFAFLIPQMTRQGSVTVSHRPFLKNGFINDFLFGIKRTMESMFGEKIIKGIIILMLVCLAALFIDFKRMIAPTVAMAVTWVLYFIAVATSLYGYNDWNEDSLGTMNLGGKYSFFMMPFIVIMLCCGLMIVGERLHDKAAKLMIPWAILILGFICYFCYIGIKEIDVVGWRKDDVREATLAWYEDEAYNSRTLVHQWDDAVFHFYLSHDDRYKSVYEEDIIAADVWIRTADEEEMREQLKSMGVLDYMEFYYVAPYYGSIDAFVKVVREAGFRTERLYGGRSVCMHLIKDSAD
jgi:hypothetical protein